MIFFTQFLSKAHVVIEAAYHDPCCRDKIEGIESSTDTGEILQTVRWCTMEEKSKNIYFRV